MGGVPKGSASGQTQQYLGADKLRLARPSCMSRNVTECSSDILSKGQWEGHVLLLPRAIFISGCIGGTWHGYLGFLLIIRVTLE